MFYIVKSTEENPVKILISPRGGQLMNQYKQKREINECTLATFSDRKLKHVAFAKGVHRGVKLNRMPGNNA